MRCIVAILALLVGLNSPVPRLAAQNSVPKMPADSWERFAYEQPHMGTTFRMVIFAPDRQTADAAAKAAFDRVSELNRIMSDYLPTSELMQLCAQSARHVRPPVPISRDLFIVLAAAQKLSAQCDGVFDVTVGPLVQLWRQVRRTQELPGETELRSARERSGWQKLKLDADKQTAQLLVPGMQLDLGGIAKGYAADEMLKTLESHGITRALVAAGGDVAVSDAPPGQSGWRVEIVPLTRQSPRRLIRLRHAAVSTSGDAEQFVEINGVRYSHIVDPRTGLGLIGRRNVTVIAPRGIIADSHTKPVSILPPETSLKLIEAIDGAAALIVTATPTGEQAIASKRFAEYVIPLNEPRNPEKFPAELTRFETVGSKPVFTAGPTTAWDRAIRERGWILREADGYKLWYTGYDGTTNGRRMLGLATSRDGVQWTRHPANPLIRNQWVEDVCIVRDGDRYIMVAEGENDRAQWFISPDGINWTHQGRIDIRDTHGKPIPDGPYGTPTLYHEANRWYLFYERKDAGIWLATSSDLRQWQHVQDAPVISPGPNEYDRDFVAMNQVIRHQGRYYAFYHGAAKRDAQPRLWSTAIATSTDLIHWEKYPMNPLRPLAENRSSGIVVPDGAGYRLYTTHPEVWLHREQSPK
ncbi:FAD:protein FMN transferase [Tuwongella immobilis]|uniref:FAD:protein FMN transferase n=1 Tax=Tuwongella immobilis TaxID=692036 RepID=A0A6C2YSK0_9BACT|nr:FAD:protein FMN transferase [Tuwongella immobilis]VIP04678.1 glycosylase : Glycosylase OS=Planctomyces maris DSM 8797 GN=PM8797T_29039 PE=4 SV=1: ApbE [Tuwongella immobilis]VTS06715.1 glycosylase : Glycosylase OS=Planctomyces maris DSM 8797 GN=PM8797T_29039 PE=4 SV=1: ApbE [Tuwongella immobilis]